MVTCHLNFQFQILVLLKGTKELGVAHYTMDTPMANSKFQNLAKICLVTTFYGQCSVLSPIQVNGLVGGGEYNY
jgi:hypothetical protein